MSTEANKANAKNANEDSAILRELDELMTYIDDDANTNGEPNKEREELIDPAFFIGNMNENGPDVPTLTTVADESVAKQPRNEERQPGLFSSRVESIKQQDSSKTIDLSQDELALIVDNLVTEQLPKLEAQLREKITAYLQDKKTS